MARFLNELDNAMVEYGDDFNVENWIEMHIQTYDDLTEALNELLSEFVDPETERTVFELVEQLSRIHLYGAL